MAAKNMWIPTQVRTPLITGTSVQIVEASSRCLPIPEYRSTGCNKRSLSRIRSVHRCVVSMSPDWYDD